ncbi:NAD+ kinase [Keratinibaculum paraultunense]|uniref:NAD kinase n=1 Tax=Keratinibaculum paraultunense TaxID=1278232 RepID=A0A4R3KTD2_9FIRM|nr:NAD(+)/NADH kinase [Keratinibaculum paraultunense]TCS87493.1 NAD+ kinase [Keratinibaculum paraultunense]
MTNNNQSIINIIANNNPESQKIHKLLTNKLEKKGFIIPKKYNNNAELNICIGGDGAFLRAVHRYNFTSIPFIGVNTGHLGFFQEVLPENIDIFIEKYIHKDFVVEKIFLVKAKIYTKNESFELYGINEIVVKGTKSKVVHLEIFIDGNHLEKFCGDGVIISTPVGSTAYNFSSGGSIIYPSLKTLQLTPLSPISSRAYRSLLNSAVIPGDLIITIKPEYRYENSILIVVDGVEYKYDDITKINFIIPEKTISRLNLDRNMYWNNLKSKFL